MRITIEPTDPNNGHCKVSVENIYDDISADKLVEMFEAAMLAVGFHQDSVKEALGKRE